MMANLTSRLTGPVLIMAGGTGGHIYPALAVADELRAQGVEVRWLGTHRGLESEVVPKAGIEISYISIAGLRGKGAVSWLTAPFKLAYAMLQSMKVLMSLRPAVVLGMGGFVTGPAGLMSFLMRYPLVIQEQNAIAGMTNRWLAKMARRVMQAFPNTFERSDVITTGNPIRSDIINLPEPEQRFAERGDSPLRLLVLGGSLGAKALNEVVPQALAQLPEEMSFDVWHQAGKRNIEEARAAYQQAGVTGRVDAYVEDMAEAYGWADIVLCRAGALTVTELACAGVGAILVPYPFAVDDHQTRNGAYLADNGAAWLIQQRELSAELLAARLKDLQPTAQGRAHLLKMAQAARSLAKPEATAVVAQHCLEVAHAN